MRRLDLSPEADFEVEEILYRSAVEFGEVAAERYRRLLQAAFHDLVEHPNRPGVGTLPGIPAGLHLYPIRHSRNRVPTEDRVGRPRHVIAFRFDAVRLEIVHLLHDSMDLPARLR